MNSSKVSVIIPVYNGADFLGEAIQSVLDQTYSNFEIIVVDDASPDHTAEVVKQFDDPRLKYIAHEENQGSDKARHTGLHAASGEIIAFLDQDDLFHPEKLQAHVALLEKHPDVGFTYNSYFNLNHSSKTIRDISRPPVTINLADLVLGFPFDPSNVVLRREWALQMDLINGVPSWCGGEIIHYGGLFLAGCKFAMVDRVLNYRRYHSGRIFKNLSSGFESELFAKDKIFADPRCPTEVLALRNIAYLNTYLIWSYYAFAQDETLLGQKLIRAAVRLAPSILDGKPCKYVDFLVANSISDESQNHVVLLQRIFAQLPSEMAQLSQQYDWAVARGYLLKGARAVIWDRPEDGRKHFEQSTTLGAQIDESFLRMLAQRLLEYEAEFGAEAAQNILQALAPYLQNIGGRASIRWLNGCYLVNRAFQSYRTGNYNKVPRMVMRAVVNHPKYLANRGVLSILLRSAIGTKLNRRIGPWVIALTR